MATTCLLRGGVPALALGGAEFIKIAGARPKWPWYPGRWDREPRLKPESPAPAPASRALCRPPHSAALARPKEVRNLQRGEAGARWGTLTH